MYGKEIQFYIWGEIMLWWEKEEDYLLEELKSDADKGLSERKAKQLLDKYGANEFAAGKKISAINILLGQFTDFMVLVLIAAATLSFFIGEKADFYAIMAIICLNAVLGFVQEYRAERSMEALLKLAAPEAKVIRDGRPVKIPAREIVQGDIIVIEAGDRIPADIRLLESYSLAADEALLTGESQPVTKDVRPLKGGNLGPADLKNMLFMGTVITRGRGKGIVVNTGTSTEMGKIATLIADSKQEETPLEKRLGELGKWLVIVCAVVCAIVALTGWLRGEPPYEMLMAGISLAVAAIPEGLPAIVTVALALGTRRMLTANALIRRLPAVETLGCTTVICSDKTGTLTENEMTVRKLFTAKGEYFVSGEGYRGNGEIIFPGNKNKNVTDTALKQVINCGIHCNTAFLDKTAAQGDPTELALITLGNKAGAIRNYAVTREFPFDSNKKRMTVVTKNPSGEYFVYAKGALESLLPLCTYYMVDERVEKITPAIKKHFLEMQDSFAGEAMRVLACAGKKGNAISEEQAEQELTLFGLVGMIDPPRKEAKQAVAEAKQAGIRTIMITGDHPLTAQKIAQELGIIEEDGKVITGRQLSEYDEITKEQLVKEAGVFARVSPEDKLTIVSALKKQGHIVAMTGDGVNDAPAVKEADIGVAMGLTGSDVTKEAAGMVLLDDNYSTIVKAVKEGRGIYENIRKFLRYLLGCNTGEVLTMFIATLFGLPLPLLPVQILWMNLVTDGLPAMALGIDKGNSSLMQKPPRNPNESVFARGLVGKISIMGISISMATLAAYFVSLYLGEGDIATARTMAFTVLVMTQLTYVFVCRSDESRPFTELLFGNNYLILAVGISLAMHLAVIYLPALSSVFHTVPLNIFQWIIVLLLTAAVIAPYIGKKSL